MAAYINTNISSLFAQKTLNTSQNALQVSMERLSSGLRINSAKDDATGLANATTLDTELRGTNQAIRNVNDALSKAQTSDGYLSQVTENMQRLSELSVQAGGTASGPETTALLAENVRLLAKVTSTGIVGGDASNTSLATVGVSTGMTATGTTTTGIAAELTLVNTARSKFGADMATFSSAISGMQTASVNVAAAKSRIMDTDYAAESAKMTRNNILQQAGTAMLAQANQQPNSVLKLLQ